MSQVNARLWRIGMVTAILAFLAISVAFVFVGRPNADEGWYLKASELVYRGEIPYRDFAYTQMPLLPYVYGLPQIAFGPSVLVGRATSMFLAIVAFTVLVLISHRQAGLVASTVTALLLATFTYGAYFQTIVKTYALLSLLFALTCFAMTTDARSSWGPLASALFATAAAAVRLSALPFALVILTYLVVTGRTWRAKLLGIAAGAMVSAGPVVLVLLDPIGAKWNLLDYHGARWAEMSSDAIVSRIAFVRAPSLLIAFAPYLVLLLFSAALAGFRGQKRGRNSMFTPRRAYAAGLLSFVFIHFVAGDWHIEYHIPAVVGFMPILGVSFAQAHSSQDVGRTSRLLLRVFLFSVLIAELVRGGWPYVDLSGGQAPLHEIQQVADHVHSRTTASDSLLVFEALWVAINADRPVLPGMTMAQFSYYDGNEYEARSRQLVNSDLLLGYLARGTARISIFTERDWQEWRRLGLEERIRAALDQCYATSMVMDNFGQQANEVYVYLRQDGCNASDEQ